MRNGAIAITFVILACCARAEAPNLIGGGLTALPSVQVSPNLAQNPGFEANSGGLPTGWTGGSGWALDQQTTHSGAFSYRWNNGPSYARSFFSTTHSPSTSTSIPLFENVL